jgi:hypothetical protein
MRVPHPFHVLCEKVSAETLNQKRRFHKPRVALYERANPPNPIRHPERTQVRDGSRAHHPNPLSARCPILSVFFAERGRRKSARQPSQPHPSS